MSDNEEIGPVPEMGKPDPDTIEEGNPVGSTETVEFTSGYGAELEVFLPEDVASTSDVPLGIVELVGGLVVEAKGPTVVDIVVIPVPGKPLIPDPGGVDVPVDLPNTVEFENG